jgi:hypothetical protein
MISITIVIKWWSILRKEDNAMNYTKPELSILGDAAAVIQQTGSSQKDSQPGDGGPGARNAPAYDLDE